MPRFSESQFPQTRPPKAASSNDLVYRPAGADRHDAPGRVLDLGVVRDAQEMVHRGGQIVRFHRLLRRVLAMRIGGTMHVASFYAATGEQGRSSSGERG